MSISQKRKTPQLGAVERGAIKLFMKDHNVLEIFELEN